MGTTFYTIPPVLSKFLHQEISKRIECGHITADLKAVKHRIHRKAAEVREQYYAELQAELYVKLGDPNVIPEDKTIAEILLDAFTDKIEVGIRPDWESNLVIKENWITSSEETVKAAREGRQGKTGGPLGKRAKKRKDMLQNALDEIREKRRRRGNSPRPSDARQIPRGTEEDIGIDPSTAAEGE